jgi:hypothetical protein
MDRISGMMDVCNEISMVGLHETPMNTGEISYDLRRINT